MILELLNSPQLQHHLAQGMALVQQRFSQEVALERFETWRKRIDVGKRHKFMWGALSRKRGLFGMKLNRRVGIGHSFIKLEVTVREMLTMSRSP